MPPTRRELIQFAGFTAASGGVLQGDVPVVGANVVDGGEELAGDGETDDGPALQALIEDTASSGGGTIRLGPKEGSYRIASRLRPATDGTPVAIVGEGNPTLDASDITGSGKKINFSGAPNVRLENLTFRGEPAAGMNYTVSAGPGFRFRHLRFLGGQGGLDISGAQDVRGEYVYSTNQHDTENGWSAALHLGNSQNVHVSHIVGTDSDRGIEVDDGPTDVTLEKIWIEDIAPTMDTYSFTLDVHRHEDAADLSNITFRDAVLRNCQKGMSASNHGPDGQLAGVTFENIVQVDCGTPGIGADDVTIRNTHIFGEERKPGTALAHTGGRLSIDGLTVHYAPSNYLSIKGGNRISHRECIVQGLYGEPAEESAGTVIQAGSDLSLSGITVSDVTVDPDVSTFAELDAGATDAEADGWGATFNDCTAGGDPAYAVAENNAPIAVRGGSSAPSTDIAVVGSRFDGTRGIAPGDVDAGVIVDGVATNDGDPSSGDGVWAEYASLLHRNGAIVWDTATSPQTPYAVDGEGNWVQWGGSTGGGGGSIFDIFG